MMMSLRKIAFSSLGIALTSAVVVVFFLGREKVIEGRKLSDTADQCRRLAEQGDANGEFDLARMYFDGKGVAKNYAEALQWYRKAAEQGHVKAEFDLGEMYLRGQGVPEDYTEALQWIQKAAKQNDPNAEAALGYIYASGKGVPQDYSEGARWYTKAAEQGFPLAQQSLAYMYYNGQGVPRNYAEAARLYRKAAEQGDVVAQQGLGYLYATGRGVPLERSEAIVWYLKAASQGDVRARHALVSLGENFEFLTALIGFPVGLWFSLGFVLPRRKLRNMRQAATTVLGVVFLSSAGLSFYAFVHDMRYSPHQDVFRTARWLLNATAILIIVTVVLPAKKKQDKTLPAARHRQS
jgi:TPR repeat protein